MHGSRLNFERFCICSVPGTHSDTKERLELESSIRRSPRLPNRVNVEFKTGIIEKVLEQLLESRVKFAQHEIIVGVVHKEVYFYVLL